MADSKVSSLAAVTTISDTDEYLVARAGATNKITGASLKTAVSVADPLLNWNAPSGAISQTFDRNNGYQGTGVAGLSGRLWLVAIHLPKGVTITSITFMGGTAATSPTHQIFGLYNSSRALLRSTTDDTNVAWGANSTKTLSLASTFVTTYAGLHYLGYMVVASATMHSLYGSKAETANLKGIAPITSGTSDTGLTTALPDPATAITVSTDTPYAYVS